MKFLDIPRQHRRSFKKHFLSTVHCELRFARKGLFSSIIQNHDRLKAAFAEIGFPQSKIVYSGKLTLQATSDGPATIAESEQQPSGLAFLSIQPRREFQIFSDHLIISDMAYQGFEDFQARAASIVQCLLRELELSDSELINKLGFRKINSIAISPVVDLQNALSIFNPAIFSSARSGLSTTESFKLLEDVLVVEENEHLFVLRTKLAKRTDAIAFDCIIDFDLVSRQSQDYNNAISQTLAEMNNRHFDIFMWVGTEQLTKLMEN